MMEPRLKNYNALIPLSFRKSSHKNGIYIQNEGYDIQDISFMTKVPLKKLRKEYSIGMILFEALVKLFNIIEMHNDEDMSDYSRQNNLKKKWDIDKTFLTYIPDMDFHMYALIDKYDKDLIHFLKYKTKILKKVT